MSEEATETKPKTEVVDKDVIAPSSADNSDFTIRFEDTQKENDDLKKLIKDQDKRLNKMEKEKDEAEKSALLTELTLLHPKLGEINKDSEIRDLKTAIKTAKELKVDASAFPEHTSGDPDKPKEKPPGYVGSLDPSSNEWI